MEKVIILGTGCAGLTAGIYAARANLAPLIIEGQQPGGQLTTTSDVENFPGFPESINGFSLMDSLRKQAARFGARFTSDYIEDITIENSVKHLKGQGDHYKAQAVIIATGASPRLLGIPGESELYGGKGVTTCATCDGAFYRGMEVVVLGGGDSACEEALFLTHFCKKITLIHRRSELRASSIMAERVLKHEKIEVVWNHIPEAILGVEEGAVRAIVAKHTETGALKEIPCKGVFIAIGHIPNTKPFENLLKLDSHGYIVPQPGSQVRTEYPGLFAAGDCVDSVYRQAITAAGMGCQAAIDAERWLSRNSG